MKKTGKSKKKDWKTPKLTKYDKPEYKEKDYDNLGSS